MQERIRRFVNERMQIIAAISHDLRTPLTRLRLRFESMEDQEQVKKALNDVNEMQVMLDSTLAFARDDASKEKKTRVDITSLVQSICDDAMDTGASINCALQAQLAFECKPVAIRRMITNIVDNAIKYGGKTDISLNQADQSIELRISDRGPGIAIEEREKVFSPFYRIEKSRNRETGGTGLGLTVARTIARAHGGDIRLDQSDNEGLVVIITLPL
jgi:signal transduction histidine kinase